MNRRLRCIGIHIIAYSLIVMHSGCPDGLNWTAQTAPWTPSGGVAASVFKDAIFMTGGKYGGTPQNPEFGYSNDIWQMNKARTKAEEK